MWGTLNPAKIYALLSLQYLMMSNEMAASEQIPTLEEMASMEASFQASRQRVTTLRKQYAQALREAEKASALMLNSLDRRAALDCHRLTDLMYRKLPIELREIIYRFLCIEDQPIPLGPYYHFRPYSQSQNRTQNDRLASALSVGRDRIDHSERPDPEILMPDSHIFKTSYINDNIAHEIREAYFSINTFSICNVDMGIFDFMYGKTTDISTLSPPERAYGGGTVPMFRVDMIDDTPAFKYASKFQLRLKYEHMDEVITKDVPIVPLSRRETFANECSFLRNAKNTLSPLHCTLAGHKTLEIELIIMTAFEAPQDQQRRFINILQSLRNTIYALKYDRKDSRIIVIHHDENISPFPRNITKLWSLTREQWEYEKEANQHRLTWDADFYLAPLELTGWEAHGGFSEQSMETLLRERWGINNAFKDREPKWPIKEGDYWPTGNGPVGWW